VAEWLQSRVPEIVVARDALSRQIDFETIGMRADVRDLDEYAARWENALTSDDFLLLGRGYLKRLRPMQASQWVAQLDQAEQISPASLALKLAVADYLTDDESARKAEQQLWAIGSCQRF
jgi:hypothetical protein